MNGNLGDPNRSFRAFLLAVLIDKLILFTVGLAEHLASVAERYLELGGVSWWIFTFAKISTAIALVLIVYKYCLQSDVDTGILRLVNWLGRRKRAKHRRKRERERVP